MRNSEGSSKARWKSLADAALFFYLDAHWNEDLPLAEELDTIFCRSSNPVVMIEDFQVPDDPDYGYDDYGPRKSLNPEYNSRSDENARSSGLPSVHAVGGRNWPAAWLRYSLQGRRSWRQAASYTVALPRIACATHI